jgi:hypothetical protein
MGIVFCPGNRGSRFFRNCVPCLPSYTRAFENKALRRIFGPKRDEVTGGWRKLHNEELHDFYSSPSIIRVVKSRRMRGRGM